MVHISLQTIFSYEYMSFLFKSNLKQSFWGHMISISMQHNRSYSLELNTSGPAPATQLTQKVLELSLLTPENVCKHFHPSDYQKCLDEIKVLDCL